MSLSQKESIMIKVKGKQFKNAEEIRDFFRNAIDSDQLEYEDLKYICTSYGFLNCSIDNNIEVNLREYISDIETVINRME